MPNEMAIQLSDGPADELIRIHTRRTDWDEPDVRYLRRKPNGKSKPVVFNPSNDHDVAFEFGNIQVTIHAEESHVAVILRRIPQRVALAA